MNKNKLTLFVNIRLTNDRRGGEIVYHKAPWIKRDNRGDVFKYSLSSYSSFNPLIEKCHFYIQLDDDYIDRKQELEDFILSTFSKEKVNLNWYRHNYRNEWKDFCDKQIDDNEIVLFLNNDDHAFIDYNTEMIESGIELLKNDPDPCAAIYTSHWPEQMRLSYHLNPELTSDKNFFKFQWNNFDAIHILKGIRLKKYWENDWGSLELYKSDHLHSQNYSLPSTFYSPTREILRHFDGYAHVGRVENIVPPLYIPPGFFENDIKLRFGFTDFCEGCINVDATAKTIRSFDSESYVDFRWVLEDIPLFWIPRISSIEYSENYDQNEQKRMRDFYFIESTKLNLSFWGKHYTPDAEFHSMKCFSNHMRADNMS